MSAGCWIAWLWEQYSHKEAVFPSHRMYVNGASQSCAAWCCGDVGVPGDGVLVRASGGVEGEMLKTSVTKTE